MRVSPGPFPFERFLQRVHRRQVALRLLERVGLGTLGGCAAALPLVGILLWRGMGAAQVAVAVPLIGAAAGVLWGVLVRPTRMATALEADRQLGWDDLLSSAMSIPAQFSNDAWAAAVRACADSKCRGFSPSTIVLHRFGARAWGGIGLSAAFVLALGSIPSIVAPGRANDRQELDANPLAVLSGAPPHMKGAQVVPRRGSAQQEPEDASLANAIDSMALPVANGESVADSTSSRGASASDSSGTGVGATQSKTAASPKPLGVGGTEAGSSTTGGRTGAGAGRTSAQLPAAGEASGQAAGGADRPAKVTPPWESAQWPADLLRANAALESGRVPDSYRDVIRDYFERP